MAPVSIAFQAHGGAVIYNPGRTSSAKGGRVVKDGGPGDRDGKKNGQVKLALSDQQDFWVADNRKYWQVSKGKVSRGKLRRTAGASAKRAKAPTALRSGVPVPKGYKGRTTIITLHGSLVPPNSRIQVSSSAQDSRQTGWKGMTVHDNHLNDLASRVGGALQFRVPTGPDGKWSGEIRLLETNNSNGVLLVSNAGSKALAVRGQSTGRKVPVSVNNKNPFKPVIKAVDPATVAPKPRPTSTVSAAKQSAFLRNTMAGWATVMRGDLRPTATFESARFQKQHARFLGSRMTQRPAVIESLPKDLRHRAGLIADQTIRMGGTLAAFLAKIKEFGISTRNQKKEDAQTAYSALVAGTDPLLNPSFLSSTPQQLVAGGIDYARKLKDNVGGIDAKLGQMYKAMHFLASTAMPTENLGNHVRMRQEVIERVASHYQGAADTMSRVIADHRGFLDEMKKQRSDMALLSGIAALAALGSIGFAYSNTLAAMGQSAAGRAAANGSLLGKARAVLKAPNSPAVFGSGTLLTQNANNAIYFSGQREEITMVHADWARSAGQLATPATQASLQKIVDAQSNLGGTYQKFMGYMFKYTDVREYTQPAPLPSGVSVGQFVPAPAPVDPNQNHPIGSVYSRHFRNERVGAGRGATVKRVEFYVRHTWYSHEQPPVPGRFDPRPYGRHWDA